MSRKVAPGAAARGGSDRVRGPRDLEVWQRAMALAARLYALASALPPVELYGIGSQIRRAAVSVPSIIAEGYGRRATGEYRHHVSIARGSVLELETLVLLCNQLGYVPEPRTSGLLDEIDQLSRMLYTLVNRLR